MTIVPESISAINCKIFDLVSRTLDISYRGLLCNGAMESESEKVIGNKFFENDERENYFKVENIGRKSSVSWNHRYFDLIHVGVNHTDSNIPLPADSTNIRPIHDADVSAIEEILLAPVHFVHTPPSVPASLIFLYRRESEPPPPSRDSSA